MKKLIVVLLSFAVVACSLSVFTPVPVDSCNLLEESKSKNASLVILTPQSNDRISSGAIVAGCSLHTSDEITWRLVSAGGIDISSGRELQNTTDSFKPYSFIVLYTVNETESASLEITGKYKLENGTETEITKTVEVVLRK